ncbi:WecB/TagA/CpsF family glycosyltransferase [Pararcticibacter amylolyticus]|uniref:Glycosyltransferase n=1 Tax=Pararcticibacter amylolyticus TaxID=2173175 RepID=A0A2U2PBR0_9SPHI|nr:WecB/TagA/CpsF family glycosyltransferase [Pararcticibacter amylolyticus]PWG78812.1 glycosyltransferase [Pararcticibacter amylolyticus]
MNQINFLGIGLNPITYSELFKKIDVWISDKSNRSHHIACVNAYNISLSLKNEKLRKIYNAADVVGADGMPFVRWIRSINKQSCDRIAAPDTILQLAEHAKMTNYTFYLYGGAPDVCVKMKEFLEEKFPHINIVGHYSPPFRELTEEEDQAIVDEINSLAPDIVCVGLGTPKQDYWIADHLHKIRGSVLIASGATFDFFGGRIKMAPTFIRRSGFEWLYRLLGKDFKRLWKRYTVMYFLFMYHFFLQKTGIAKYHLIDSKHNDFLLEEHVPA